jgi:hypothetical protein
MVLVVPLSPIFLVACTSYAADETSPEACLLCMKGIRQRLCTIDTHGLRISRSFTRTFCVMLVRLRQVRSHKWLGSLEAIHPLEAIARIR